ncbi:MAG: 50S ribosomal protein L11 methyltransferase, partial [Bacteroidota bacterium]
MEYTKVFIYCECLPGEVTELLIACLSGIGFESFEEKKTGLDAYIPSGFFDENELIKLLYNTVFQDFKLSYQIYRIPEKNWNKEWESNFSPTIIRDLCYIRAPFHPGRDNFRYELVILPRMSFGTGHHQTTRLMIESMLETDLNEKVVLDLGCGTGIL